MKFALGRFFLLWIKANALQAVKRVLYYIQQRGKPPPGSQDK